MSYLGRSAKLSLKAQEKVSFLATAGQTVKTGLSYTVGFIEVYVNGVLLTDTTDFTATNGNSITFTVALLLNDEVTVISLKTFTVADHYSKTEADTLLAAKATNTAVALKAPIASPVFTGNVGVGVTPEAWDSSHKALQVGAALGLSSDTTINRSHISSAAYQDGTSHTSGWKYMDSSSGATDIHTYNGGIDFRVAPSGSADAAISWTTAMTIDNAGIVTKPLQPAFDAYSNQNAYSSGTSISSTNINTTRLNTGNHYSTSGQRFVAPVAGVYQFNYRTMINGATSNAHLRMYKNGSTISGSDAHYSSTSGTSWNAWSISLLVSLAANDYVQIGHTSNESIYGNNYQSFNGHLIG